MEQQEANAKMSETLETILLDERAKLLAFVRKKISDPELAEDVLQDSLLKAVGAAPDLQNKERIIPWFYRILNNAIIDTYRHHEVETRYLETYGPREAVVVEPEDEATLCACFRALLPTLPADYAELIETLELNEGDPAEVAERLQITRNNLKVRRHRARQALRQRLEQTCRVCATHGCLDCTCESPLPTASST